MVRFPLRNMTQEENKKLIECIEKIMDPTKRMYLTVFSIQSGLDLKQTTLHAIFKGNSLEVSEKANLSFDQYSSACCS